MGVAAYVLDGDPAPPLLLTAFDVRTYHTDYLALPAGVFRGLKEAYNAYYAIQGYKNAVGKTAQWTQQHPDAWEFVSQVLKARMEKNNG